MSTFQLPADNQIRGDQLAAEILAATGIDVADRYGFRAPSTVEIAGVEEHEAAIQAVIDAHTPVVPVPRKISTWRLHAVTEIAGLTAQIASAIDALPQPSQAVAHAAWYRSFETERDSVLLAQMAAVLNLTAAEVDQMFRDAAALVV